MKTATVSRIATFELQCPTCAYSLEGPTGSYIFYPDDLDFIARNWDGKIRCTVCNEDVKVPKRVLPKVGK